MAVRQDLNGLRVKSPGWNQAVRYLIDQGQKRAIPDDATYQRMFRYNALDVYVGGRGVIPDMFINEIDDGPAITSGAFLAEPIGDPHVYFVDGNSKRWITSPEAMDRYYFDWGLIQKLPAAALNAIPNGPDINA
jgi:hypothetical protein